MRQFKINGIKQKLDTDKQGNILDPIYRRKVKIGLRDGSVIEIVEEKKSKAKPKTKPKAEEEKDLT